MKIIDLDGYPSDFAFVLSILSNNIKKWGKNDTDVIRLFSKYILAVADHIRSHFIVRDQANPCGDAKSERSLGN